jgi:hypothetical protein
MGHEDHGFGAVVDGIFDCWDCACDSLRVGDFLVAVEWDVEIDLECVSTRILAANGMLHSFPCCTYSNEDPLALQVNILDGELV